MPSRRKILAGAAASTLATAGTLATASNLQAQQQGHDHGQLLQIESAKPTGPKKPLFFQPAELELLGDLMEVIVPATDTPGAKGAGAHYFVDSDASRDRRMGDALRKDLAWVQQASGGDFRKLSQEKQVALMTAWMGAAKESAEYKFFRKLKNLTIDTYYVTRIGLTQELGWNANTFLREYKGCSGHDHSKA